MNYNFIVVWALVSVLLRTWDFLRQFAWVFATLAIFALTLLFWTVVQVVTP